MPHRLNLPLALMLLVPAAALAQSPGASNASMDTTLAQTLTSAPIAGQTGVAVNAGLTFMSGRTETRGWTLDGIGSYTTKRRLVIRAEAESARTRYAIAPGQPLATIEDHSLASLLFLRPVHNHISLIATTGWARDALLQLDHRAWVEGGIAFHLLEHPNVNFMVAPLFAVGAEHRSFTDAADSVNDIGVLQSFTLKFNQKFVFEEFLAAHADVTNNRDSSTMFNVSLLSEVFPKVNVKLYYQYNYAELVPVGQDPLQTTAGVALQIAFVRMPKAPPAAAPATPPAKP